MINTVFHFVNDPTFDYMTAVNNGDISEYTIVFNAADRSIWAKNSMFGRMSRADIVQTLGNISDIIPAATSNSMGGIKIGYTPNANDGSKKYAVMLDLNNRAYVDVPWTDTVTPSFDDTELQQAIDAQRFRIDNYINNLVQTVQDCTETLLTDAQWVTENLAAGETGRQINDNIDEYFRQQYGVWDWVDPNDHSKGKVVRTSVIEQNVDSIEAYTGMVVPSGYTGRNLTTAIARMYQDVGRDFDTGQVSSSTGLMADVANLNEETGAIDQAIIAALDLKAKTGANTYEAITDLASVYSDSNKQLYSGLNARVSNVEGGLEAESSLMSRVLVKNGNKYEVQADIISGVVNSATFSNGVATATATLSSTVDGHTAAIATKVSKSNGKIESGVTISADQVIISGNTTVKGKLSAVSGDISTLTANDVTIGNAAAAAQSTANKAQATANSTSEEFIRLANGNGTFTGNVNAKTLIAGDPNGINIKTSLDKIEFCQGGDVRAYFVANGQGMQLHVWDSNGVEHYIDFTKWQSVSGTSYSTVSGYYRITSSGFTPATDIEKGSDGKYYIHSGSQYTPVSESLYTKQNVNATDSNGSGIACIFAKYNAPNSGTYAINIDVDRYIKNTFSSGSITGTSSNYVYYCDRYPQTVTFSGSNISSISATGKFINPTADSAQFQFRYIYGATQLLNPTVQYTYVGTTSYTSTYSTSPTLYYTSSNSQT